MCEYRAVVSCKQVDNLQCTLSSQIALIVLASAAIATNAADVLQDIFAGV